MKYRKISAVVLAAAAATALSLPAFAASLTADQAKAAAEKLVPAGSTYYNTDSDDGRYEIKFYNNGKSEKYEVDFSKATGKVVSFDSERFDHRGSVQVKLSEEDAKKKVIAEFPGAEILSAVLETDDGLNEYTIRFKTDSYYGKITVHPESGIILERDIQIGSIPTSTATSSFQGLDKITQSALAQVPGGVITDMDLDDEGGTYLYEVELYKDGTEYHLFYDAATGNLLHQSSHQDDWEDDSWRPEPSAPSANAGTDIGIEKAKEIALAKVPGAIVKKCELDYDDGRRLYEGELYKDGWEYEFEIDAATGSVLSWEQDYDD